MKKYLQLLFLGLCCMQLHVSAGNNDYLKTFLAGGAGKEKTWYLDIDANGVSKYFTSPLYYSGTDNNWESITNGYFIGSTNSWYWCPVYKDATWVMPVGDYGSMTFDMKNDSTHVTVNHKMIASLGTQTGTYILDVDNHTMKMTGASILHEVYSDGNVPSWDDIKILSLTNNAMQLGVMRDSTLLLVYNFVSKDFYDNIVKEIAATVSVAAGGLSSAFSYDDLYTITKLTITGTIDARDFKTIRSMLSLTKLDLSKATIVEYTGTEGPDTANITYPFKEIPIDAFNGNKGLISIILPDSILSIGNKAFLNCNGISNINIPASVSSIAKLSFEGCSNLTEYVVQTGNNYYSSLGGVLFDKVQSVLIKYPGSMTGSYVIPSTIKTIGFTAFDFCFKVTSVTIPASVATIDTAAFAGCVNLNSVVMEEGLTTIGDNAFGLCSSLTSVSIPSTVKTIESYAFSLCSKLDSVYVYSSTPIDLSLSKDVFGFIPTTCKLFVPAGSKEAYQNANQWKDFKQIIELTTSLQSICQSNIKIEISNGKLIVNNTESGNVVQIYSASGFKLKEQKVESNQTSFSLPKGIYVIRVGNYSGKVVVK